MALVPGGVEVLEPKVGDERREDDGERRGKAFEDVVGVLDDRRDDQTAQRLCGEKIIIINTCADGQRQSASKRDRPAA